MTQNEGKMKITEQELYKKFNEGDLDSNGALSSDQITKLLQNIGFQDVYKGTIKKICKKINKSKGKLQGNNEAAITFQQFKSYFDVIQSPSDRFIFMKQLSRKQSIQQIAHKMKDKHLFPKQKGQKIKINCLVGQKLQNYPNTIDLSFYKHLDNKNDNAVKDHNDCYLKIVINCQSQQNAKELTQILKPIQQMMRQVIGGQDQELAGLLEVIDIHLSSQECNTVIFISTKNTYLKSFLFDYSQYLDMILKIEVTFLIKLHFGFQFLFQNLKNDKKARIEQILARNSHLKFKYQGSQFMNSVKQILLEFAFFQVLYNVDPYDQQNLFYLSFLSSQNAELNLKFKNVQKVKPWPTEITSMFLGALQQMNQFLQQDEQLNLKRIFELIGNTIKIQGCLKNVKLNASINIKDLGKILKTPMIDFQNQEEMKSSQRNNQSNQSD